MRIPLALMVVSALWSCSEPYAGGRLKPGTVPKLASGPSVSGGATESAANAPQIAVAAMPRVATAIVTEDEVLGHVENLVNRYGAAGLRALPVGTTLAERLQFCQAQILLGRVRETIPELERMSIDHAETPLVWRQLGHAHYWADDIENADRCMRRAYALAAANDFATCPSLPSFLGELLIERPKTRDDGIRILRNELADGQDYARAAWALQKFLAVRERHAEALACLDAALSRDPKHTRLLIGKAKVLLALHRTKEGVELLAPLLAKDDADEFAIDTMMRHRILRNEFAKALPLIDRMIAWPGLVEADRTALQVKREAIAKAVKTGFRELVPTWKVEAIVRGHPDVRLRIKILRQVMKQDNPRLRQKCLEIALYNESVVVRAEGLVAMVPDSKRPLVDLKVGFDDGDSTVRGVAAILAGELRTNRDQATALLLEYMSKESDTYAFRQMHSALVTLTGREFELPFGAIEDPKQRLAIVERWRNGK